MSPHWKQNSLKTLVNPYLHISGLIRSGYTSSISTLELRLSCLFAPVEFSFENSYVATLCSPCSPRSRVSTPAHIGWRVLPRKEVIQPHLPVRLPCYDFTPVTNPALGRCSLTVSPRTSGVVDFHGVTGGVYKTRERIQRSVLICVY